MCFALSTCVLFISLIQSVNGAQFLNITFLLLSPAPPATDIVPLTSIYASLYSHKIDFNIVDFSLTCLLVFYVPRESSFILTKFFSPRI